jgi:hypothetical protein
MRAGSKLEVAQNLVRIYREVLELPVPAELDALVKRLQAER